MIQNALTALIPCRDGSLRIKNKNTRPFGPNGESLLEIKLRQLSKLDFVSEIILSTNDDQCIAIAEATLGDRVSIDHRPSNLCTNSTNLTDLIEHMGLITRTEFFLWTHVTSPFFGSQQYSRAFQAFSSHMTDAEPSLVAAEQIQDFVYFMGRPVNFGADNCYWPQTQDLEPLYRVTSGAFFGKTDLLVRTKNRVSERPVFFPVEGPSAIDIDWPQDFDNATDLARTLRENLE